MAREGESALEIKTKLIITAQIAHEADRCDDMADCMRKATEVSGGQLSLEERDLLSVAFKNATAARRLSWRIIAGSEQNELESSRREISKSYRHQIEGELLAICQLVVTLLDEHLIPASNDNSSKIFYYKMKGDYCRYKAELLIGTEKEKVATESETAYKMAEAISNESLTPYHPLRLGLYLNHAVLHYEIFNDSKGACTIAKKAISDAEKFSSSNNSETEGDDDDGLSIFNLLKDNLAIWTHDADYYD